MAKVEDGSRSQLSGKADGLVYVRFNGGVYTRKIPKWKKESFTRGMLKNMERFKRVNAFCALFRDELIPQIWNGAEPKMSGYALFLKTNMAAFGKDGNLEDAKKIMLSTGGRSFPEGMEVSRSQVDDHLLEVKWPREMNVGGVHLKDELMVVSAADGQYSELMGTGIERNEMGGTFALPAFPMPQAPGPMHLYLFFASKDRRDYSPSECFEV